MTITASAVSELRKETNYPLMACKEALTQANGDVEQARNILREKLGAASKSFKVALEGTIALASNGINNTYAMVEIATETDFTANSEEVRTAAGLIVSNKVLGINSADDDVIKDLRAKTLENIQIRRLIHSQSFTGSSVRIVLYLHHDKKLGAVVVLDDAEHLSHEVRQQIAMHIASTDPTPVAVDPENVTGEVVDKELQYRTSIAAASGKPHEIQQKMIAGAMNKFKAGLALRGQPFVMDPKKTVGDILGTARVLDFKKWSVGSN